MNFEKSKNVLIIHPGPLGFHSGTYYYCKLLKEKYEVFYVGIDQGGGYRNDIEINETHLEPIRNRFIRKFNYFRLVFSKLVNIEYVFVLINYFPLCSLFLVVNRKLVVEVRTGYIFKSKFKRGLYNVILKYEVKLFQYVTTLSDSLKHFLRLPERTKIIPIGGPFVENREKQFNDLCFLYVGTFRQRNIHKTIEGFYFFIKSLTHEQLHSIKLIYNIIGFGSDDEINLIKDTISKFNLSGYVFFRGEIRYPELFEYFDLSNVGISYIPNTTYFQTQPVTKTCEYLLNGMPVLATGLNEHLLIVNSTNGIIINEDVESISNGFINIYLNRKKYNSRLIQNGAKRFSWQFIINEIMIPFINSVK